MTLATFLTEQKKHKEFKKVCKTKGLQMSVIFNNAIDNVLTEHANKSKSI